jgi:ketopantoate reductase
MENLKDINKSNEIKKKKIIILGYWQVWQYFFQVLKENWCENVFIVSRRKSLQSNNWDNLPVKINEVDYIINTHKVPDIKWTTESIPKDFEWKILYVQNWFDIKELVKEMWIKNSLFAVLNISAKSNNSWKLWVKILKESPIFWDWSKDIENLFNKPNLNIFKESGNFDREVIKKWIINSIFNPLCVIYNKNAKNAIDEYWFDQLENLSHEIVKIVNCWCRPKIGQEEIRNYIMKVYETFWEDFPNTYGDFYEKSWEKYILRKTIKKHELDHLIWYLLKKSKEYWIKAPLIKEIHHKIEEIENIK